MSGETKHKPSCYCSKWTHITLDCAYCEHESACRKHVGCEVKQDDDEYGFSKVSGALANAESASKKAVPEAGQVWRHVFSGEKYRLVYNNRPDRMFAAVWLTEDGDGLLVIIPECNLTYEYMPVTDSKVADKATYLPVVAENATVDKTSLDMHNVGQFVKLEPIPEHEQYFRYDLVDKINELIADANNRQDVIREVVSTVNELTQILNKMCGKEHDKGQGK